MVIEKPAFFHQGKHFGTCLEGSLVFTSGRLSEAKLTCGERDLDELGQLVVVKHLLGEGELRVLLDEMEVLCGGCEGEVGVVLGEVAVEGVAADAFLDGRAGAGAGAALCVG